MRVLAVILLLASLVAGFGCATPEPESKYIVDSPTGPIDTRVSSNGYTRPTLADRTVTVPVHYRNPNTGTESDYECEVDLDSDGKVQRVNWPTSGWTEADDLTDNGDGTQTLTDDRGYEYTVDLSSETTDETSDEDSGEDSEEE